MRRTCIFIDVNQARLAVAHQLEKQKSQATCKERTVTWLFITNLVSNEN